MEKQKALDPITVEVIKNALTSVANEMSISLRRTSMSPILYEMLDFCVDLYNSKTELIAEGRGAVVFQGTVNFGIDNVTNHVGKENVEEGDVFIAAWSYFAGSHNPDVLVFKPIFYEKNYSVMQRLRRIGQTLVPVPLSLPIIRICIRKGLYSPG